MKTEPIPFVDAQMSGWDELAGASPLSMNAVVDGSKTVMRRPGISAYSGATSAVIDANGIAGLHATSNRKLLAVGASGAERPIYNVTGSGASALGGGVAPAGLRGSLRPVFAETEMLLVIAGGSDMQKVELGSLSSSRLGGAPPKASHVIANASRLLANDMTVDRSAVRFSGVAGGEVSFAGLEVWAYGGFGTSGYFSAEGKPDDVAALLENTNEVVVPGTATTQSFVPDPAVTYAPVGTTELGLSAPYSAVKVDQHYAWIDHLRRIVLTDGRSFKDISTPISKTLDGVSTMEDAFGYRVAQGHLDVLCWTFPTDGRTFVFQAETGWGQWSGWRGGNWSPLNVMSCVTLPAWSPAAGQPASTLTTLVGTVDGKIGQFDLDATTDFGEPIPFFVRTGFLNRGTDHYKQCLCVRVALRRGTTTSSVGPQAFLRYSDAPGRWSVPIPVDLGESGATEIVVSIRSLGTYQRRQWEFRYDGPEKLRLVSVEEEFEVLGI